MTFVRQTCIFFFRFHVNAVSKIFDSHTRVCTIASQSKIASSILFSDSLERLDPYFPTPTEQAGIGYKPVPRHGYKPPPPNGCGSPMFGFHFDIGIPSMTKCCNQHDRCYDTCGSDKHDCDEQFQFCLETICRNVQKTLGLSHSVQACKSAVSLLFDAVMHLGCKPYLDSQRASCMCLYEDKQEL